MRSTGEVMGIARDFPAAFAKAQAAAGTPLPTQGTAFISVTDADKAGAFAIAQILHDSGFRIVATRGTAQTISRMGVPVEALNKIGEGSPHVVDWIERGDVDIVVNTPTGVGRARRRPRDPPRRRFAPHPVSDDARGGRQCRARDRAGRARRRRRSALPAAPPRRRRPGGRRVSGVNAAARILTVAEVRPVGAYVLLAVTDPAGDPLAGQFSMLATAEGWGDGVDGRPFLPRAVSFCARRGDRSLYLLEDVGPGTRLLCGLQPGASVRSLGPLGAPFRPPSGGARPVIVGGGIGVAPLVMLAEQLEDASVLLGFRERGRARAAELFARAKIATDDGSVGHEGSVVELLERQLDGTPVTVYSCGPAPLLEAVRARCESAGVECQLALEAPMACGFGACWGCAVPRRGGGYLRVCVDGPVLDGALLDRVDELAGAPA